MSATYAMRELRIPLRGNVRYEYDSPRDGGLAHWIDVSRVGAALHIGRYLRPGREVTLYFESPLVSGTELAVRARIVWCRPLRDCGTAFVVGLQVHREDPKLALDFAALGYRARAAANRTGTKTVEPAVWPGFSSPHGDEHITTACAATA